MGIPMPTQSWRTLSSAQPGLVTSGSFPPHVKAGHIWELTCSDGVFEFHLMKPVVVLNGLMSLCEHASSVYTFPAIRACKHLQTFCEHPCNFWKQFKQRTHFVGTFKFIGTIRFSYPCKIRASFVKLNPIWVGAMGLYGILCITKNGFMLKAKISREIFWFAFHRHMLNAVAMVTSFSLQTFQFFIILKLCVKNAIQAIFC